ncbi:starch-binding protein, partial [Klebsiella pneumoniae]|uniref:starch-binding protein n=1 Tax=Klebsiella pneumoniae TaxID=573 RepID=UPI00272FC040
GPGWPGTAMLDVGDDWYFFQMPDGVRSTNLIFNDADGSGEQTGDLFRNQNGCYENNQWNDSCPQSE